MNIKCVIGATILTPIVLSLWMGVIMGIVYLINNFPILHVILLGILASIFVVFVWCGVYFECKERNKK